MADVEVQAVAAALEQARISAEVSGEYMQAEACRRQLAELEVLDDKRKLEALAAEQLAQRIGMDEAHMVELGQLQAFWNHRLAEIEQKAHLVEDEMLRRFADELSDLREQRADTSPQRATGNAALIELRRKEQALVRSLHYEQAAKVKAQADALEASVFEKLQQQHAIKRRHVEELIKRKQHNELSALRMRVRAGREEHLREKEADEARLMLRYKNLANDLDAQQRAEQQKLARAPRPALTPRRGGPSGAGGARGTHSGASPRALATGGSVPAARTPRGAQRPSPRARVAGATPPTHARSGYANGSRTPRSGAERAALVGAAAAWPAAGGATPGTR